mmetsp:Transcript_39714/g.99434  ORF Transcript_39714/g.99434 Transcript_39714/m.99434 type:complete len:202 (-) Transcript_39714:433-1038(-)
MLPPRTAWSSSTSSRRLVCSPSGTASCSPLAPFRSRNSKGRSRPISRLTSSWASRLPMWTSRGLRWELSARLLCSGLAGPSLGGKRGVLSTGLPTWVPRSPWCSLELGRWLPASLVTSSQSSSGSLTRPTQRRGACATRRRICCVATCAACPSMAIRSNPNPSASFSTGRMAMPMPSRSGRSSVPSARRRWRPSLSCPCRA